MACAQLTDMLYGEPVDREGAMNETTQARSARIEARAADFLQKKRFWQWGENDQAGFDAWLNEDA